MQAPNESAGSDAGERKPFLLRLPPDLHAELKRWAAAELRSLNGQIEFVLRDALRRRGAKTGPERSRERQEGPPFEEPCTDSRSLGEDKE